ncbi:mucin-2 [Ceratobasidium sp. AG-Ba]|nr:mucin-2 [Ceratobasidium sp. AG-Ba]
MSVPPPKMHKSHAPVINPYDKLSQTQFDSYVSNIQAKIQLALNPPSPEPQHVSRSIAEISHSTIASPAPTPAPLSKRSSLEPRAPIHSYTPIGAGTPNEPFELSDDEDGGDEDDEPVPQAKPLLSSGSEADDESNDEQEPVPLSAIPEDVEQADESEEEHGTDEAEYSEHENENGPQEVEWDYSGEEASDEEEASGVEEGEEAEEEDVFIGKGKGRHPAEGPGLSALLHSSGTRAGVTGALEDAGRHPRMLDDSFEQGVGRMRALGTTSTPFISRLRARPTGSQEDSDDGEDAASPPWEVSQGMSAPAVATYQEEESEEGSYEESDREDRAGAAREDAIEVLDSDEEEQVASTPKGIEADEMAHSPMTHSGAQRLHDNTEFDQLQFDDSAAYPDEAQEPDSLLDDTMDGDDSMRLQVFTDGLPQGPSSLFSASSIAVTREPSQSKDTEELEHSADTVHAPEYNVEEPDIDLAAADPEHEFDQSIQKSLDYSDFIGERSLLGQQDTSTTQAEQQLHEVTVYELENGSRYYDFDGVRHFLNPEGEVYETAAIPPPRPTIQQAPDLTMIEEVTEYDITRRMGRLDEEDGEEGENFDFLKGLNESFSSVGGPMPRYQTEDTSGAFEIDDIPQRPGAALGFRSRNGPGADSSGFLSDSVVLGDDLTAEHDTSQPHAILNQLGPKSSFVSATGTIEESVTGRGADDLVSEDDIVSASEAGGDADADESHDSILDDDDDDTTRELDSRILDRDDLATPVPPKADESGMESQLLLDEKGVTDALAAVAQLAEETSFEEFLSASGVEVSDVNGKHHPIFGPTQDLENLLKEVPSMSAEEEDMLARSFNMADALHDATIPLGELPTFDDASTQIAETTVETSILGELNPIPLITVEGAHEKLASDVLAEVFEGVEPVSMSSAPGTGTVTPSGDPENSAQIEEIEVQSRSPTPEQSLTEPESVAPSTRRTPPTPTLSVGQSLTAPELSVATSISEPSVAQPNVSVYEGSPTSSTHQENTDQVIPPIQAETTELPDPNLPPSPTHLSMPTLLSTPSITEVQGEPSASVVVEPPTPQATSEDGATEANATAKPAETDGSAEASERLPLEDGVVEALDEPTKAEKEQTDEETDVIGPLAQGINTPSRRPRARSLSTRSSARESSTSRTTPSPDEKAQVGEKRKRLEDLPSPTPTPLRRSTRSPARKNEEIGSPLDTTNQAPGSPTPRQIRSPFRRTPSKPLSTGSGTPSRKTSGSDQAPAPWPLRQLTHRHGAANQSLTSPRRSKGTSTGSPTPRSSCRFHKVVITQDNESNSTEFVIPACALNRPEILKELGAKDCGLSTAEEEAAMITDFSSAEPNVVDKLKALVGTSLFDEGTCGYLPKPTAVASRPIPARLKGSLRGSIGDFKFEPNPESEDKTAPIQTKPKPRSRPSIRHDDRLYKPPVESESNGSTDEEPTRKRPKHKPRDRIGSMSSVKFPSLGQDSPQKPVPQQPESRVLISRRMKRARKPADAQPYKPDPSQDESSPDDENKGNPRKRIKNRAPTTRRTSSITSTQGSKPAEDDENPFKPKHELNRMRSPDPTANETGEQSAPSLQDSKPSPDEQKDLEHHVQLGDHPGEVVTEEGEHMDAKQLPEPAPAKVAAYVDRDAPSDVGKNESNSAGENALGTKNNAKKGWSKFLRF